MDKKIRVSPKRFFRPVLKIGLALIFVFGLSVCIPAGQAEEKSASVYIEVCLACHSRPNMVGIFPNKEKRFLTINKTQFGNSVHKDVPCFECHPGSVKFPHPKQNIKSGREFAMKSVFVCRKCHAEQNSKMADSVHARAINAGNSNAAICTDCHNPHEQLPITDEKGAILPEARLRIPGTCNTCHSTIYAAYKESVHGAALTQEKNGDTPTCIDCHGVHNISDPKAVSFRLSSPQVCSKCHTNKKIMDKYGLSTEVLNTYVSDFHGTTVTLFKQSHADADTNKPVCFDCHGIHNIRQVDDPVHGIAMKQNLLVACRRCHPDANLGFPDAWMSHYIPSVEKYPIVFFVNLFYWILIPLVVGGMVIFVLTDVVRRTVRRIGASRNSQFGRLDSR